MLQLYVRVALSSLKRDAMRSDGVHYHLKSSKMFGHGLLVTIAASGLIGCGSNPLPPDTVGESGSKPAQSLSSSKSFSGSGISGISGGGITEYPVPTARAVPFGITVGPDGNIWFTETNSDKVAKITAAGKITEYLIPTAGTPGYIVAGPAGNLWFTEHFAPSGGSVETASVIDEITPNGKIVNQFDARTDAGIISGLAVGPDGNLWYTDPIGNNVERLTPAGTVTTYPLANGTGPGNIAPGPDEDLWFTENFWSGRVGSTIAKITTAGIVSAYPLATNAGPNAVAASSSVVGAGNLWFTEAGTNKIGKITTTAGDLCTQDSVPTANAGLFDITESPDGRHWFTEYNGNKIGKVDIGGEITEYPIPTVGAQPEGITATTDGKIWFTEAGSNKIGMIVPVNP